MSVMSDIKLANPVKGPGLKTPGVVLIQFLLILLFEAIEYSFTKVGLFTGVALLVSWIGGIYLGRKGTEFAAVVTPPLAFFLATVFLIATVGGTGFSISHIGLDLISMLGAEAPFLLVGAFGGWAFYFAKGRKN